MNTVKCPICNACVSDPREHITNTHSELVPYPDVQYNEQRMATKITPVMKGLANISGIPVDVNTDVPEEACIPLPKHYRVPVHIPLSKDVYDAVLCLKNKRSLYISGHQGTGKDAIAQAYSWLTRTPGKVFQIDPEENIKEWFYTQEFDREKTYWREGDFLKAVRDGYKTPSGRVVPYLVVISDFDRATPYQAESLRLTLDAAMRKVKGPNGVFYDVLAGTTFIITANTTGGGDSAGKYTSSNIIDMSMMDRMERGIRFSRMANPDLNYILVNTFPELYLKDPKIFTTVTQVATAICNASDSGNLFYELSMRGLYAWLGATQDQIRATPEDKDYLGILKSCLRFIKDKTPNVETAIAIDTLADPFFKDQRRR